MLCENGSGGKSIGNVVCDGDRLAWSKSAGKWKDGVDVGLGGVSVESWRKALAGKWPMVSTMLRARRTWVSAMFMWVRYRSMSCMGTCSWNGSCKNGVSCRVEKVWSMFVSSNR